MKKTFSLFLLSCFLVSITSAPGYGQKVSDILGKMIKARGGKTALKSIKDITFTGTMEMPAMGASGSIVLYQKEPDQSRWDIDMAGMVLTRATDGKTAWGTNFQTGALEALPEQEAAEFNRNALGYTSMLNPKKYGLSHALKGKEQIDGKDHFVLEQTYSDGFKVTLYVDCKTYLTTKSKGTQNTQAGEVEFEKLMSDYKKVNGIMIPHSMTTYQNGTEYMKITLTEIKFNTGLEDSFFKMN